MVFRYSGEINRERQIPPDSGKENRQKIEILERVEAHPYIGFLSFFVKENIREILERESFPKILFSRAISTLC